MHAGKLMIFVAVARTYSHCDVNRVRVHNPIQVPALLRHLVAHLVNIYPGVPRRERNDRGRWVSEHIDFAVQLRLDPLGDLSRGTDDRTA